MDHILASLNAASDLIEKSENPMKEPRRIGTFENAGAVLVRGKSRGEFIKSLLIASLENIVKYDADADLRAACRARYLDLTGKELQQ